jgi:hypothetical protein
VILKLFFKDLKQILLLGRTSGTVTVILQLLRIRKKTPSSFGKD